MNLSPSTLDQRLGSSPDPAAGPGSLPLISVVTPSHNQGPFLERCIQSVLAQDYPHFEHIVYDNRSTDQTHSILRRYPHVVWTSEPDSGQTPGGRRGCRRTPSCC